MQRKLMLACFGMAGVLLLAWLIGGQGGASAYQAANPAVSTQDVVQATPVAVAAKTTRRPVVLIPPPTATSIPLTLPEARELGAAKNAAPVQNAAAGQDALPPTDAAAAKAQAAIQAAAEPAAPAVDASAASPAAVAAAAPIAAAAPVAAPPAEDENPAPAADIHPVRRLMDPAAPAQINGVPLENILVLSEDTIQTVRRIYAHGQQQGRNPNAFAKVGDSTMAWPPLLDVFSAPGGYELGPYAYLQPTVARYRDAFGWTSAAVKKGMHSWGQFDPSWVSGNRCRSGETPLACELRLTNPSVAFIRLGANDAFEPTEFDHYMRQIVGLCVTRGVIPVLGTKPDRVEGSENTINKLIARIAEDYGVPLWDYDRIAATVPGKGLLDDGIHYRGIGPHDYASAGTFTNGDSLEDLTALMMLDVLARAVAAPTEEAALSGVSTQN